jgi:hypothetical protein
MSAPVKKKEPPWLDAKLKKFGISPFGRGAIHAAVGTICVVLFAFTPAVNGAVILMYLSPLWLMYVAPKSFNFFWLHYVQHQFTASPRTKGVLLEIRLPREISHSPKAMELVYEALHFRPQMATKFLTHWRGHVRPWYSIEIVSMKGELKFYIWCWERLRDQVEVAFYSQYPTIQIVTASEDYAAEYVRKKGPARNFAAWGNALMLERPDAYPIKTYYDFQLDQDPKAELKNDPFVTVLEQMSSNGPTEILWMQILFQPEWTNAWKPKVMEEIKSLYDKTRKPYKSATGKEEPGYAQLKPMQFDVIRSMERSTMKQGFNVAIRSLVIFEDGKFNNMMTQALNQMWRPLGVGKSGFYNSIAPDGEKHTNGFDWPWEFSNIRRPPRVQKMFDAYVARSAFAPPHIEDPFILTSEELATVFHLPGEEAKALGIKRLESTQKGAPPNLPI